MRESFFLLRIIKLKDGEGEFWRMFLVGDGKGLEVVSQRYLEI